MEHVIIPVDEYNLLRQIYDNIAASGKMELPHYRHAQRKYYYDNRQAILRKMRMKRVDPQPRRTVVIRFDDPPTPAPDIPPAAVARY